MVLLPVQASASSLGDLVLRRGRLPDPAAIDEVVLTERMAGFMGVDVGAVVVGQIVGRAVQRTAGDRRVLRDLGLPRNATRRTGVAAGALTVAVAVVTSVVAATTELATDAMVPVTVALVLAGAATSVVLAGTAAGRLAVRRPAAEVLRSE